MSTMGTTHFRELYFEYKYLTRISVDPTFALLHEMLLQLKANTISVPSTLDREAYGYAKGILSPLAYAILLLILSFITPNHPGLITVAVGATQYEIVFASHQHKEALRFFQNFQLIKRSLIQ